MTGRYVAPATEVLVQSHVRDPAGVPGDGAEGVTVCGRQMLRAELWLPVQLLPGDRVCRGCAGAPGPVAEQATLPVNQDSYPM